MKVYFTFFGIISFLAILVFFSGCVMKGTVANGDIKFEPTGENDTADYYVFTGTQNDGDGSIFAKKQGLP
jgi:hypothetical protein